MNECPGTDLCGFYSLSVCIHSSYGRCLGGRSLICSIFVILCSLHWLRVLCALLGSLKTVNEVPVHPP